MICFNILKKTHPKSFLTTLGMSREKYQLKVKIGRRQISRQYDVEFFKVLDLLLKIDRAPLVGSEFSVSGTTQIC